MVTALLWVPLPTLNQAYNMVIQKESPRGMTSVASANVVSSSDNRVKMKPNIECDFFHKRCYTKDRCYARVCEFCHKKGYLKDNCFILRDLKKGKKKS